MEMFNHPLPHSGLAPDPTHPDTDVPRCGYPRPQFVRPDWMCLNGEWEFEIDRGDSGHHRGLLERPLNDDSLQDDLAVAVVFGHNVVRIVLRSRVRAYR